MDMNNNSSLTPVVYLQDHEVDVIQHQNHNLEESKDALALVPQIQDATDADVYNLVGQSQESIL